jgi:hypothetical protein
MTDAVIVAIIGLVGTMFSATAAAYAAIQGHRVSSRIGQPNGSGSLIQQIDDLTRMLVHHIEDDNRRFATLLSLVAEKETR